MSNVLWGNITREEVEELLQTFNESVWDNLQKVKDTPHAVDADKGDWVDVRAVMSLTMESFAWPHHVRTKATIKAFRLIF